MIKITLKKPVLAVIGLFSVLAVASGQSPTPPEPRQPLLPRAPAQASWSVAFKYSGEEKPSEPTTPPRPLGEVPRTIVITKVNTVYREQIELATGKKVERWDFGGTLFNSNAAGTVFLNVAPTEDAPAPEYYDRRRSDFPELDWISKATYRGVGSFQGGRLSILKPREMASSSPPISRWIARCLYGSRTVLPPHVYIQPASIWSACSASGFCQCLQSPQAGDGSTEIPPITSLEAGRIAFPIQSLAALCGGGS